MPAPHEPPCGCNFCISVSRIRWFVTSPARDSRLAEVAAQRLRILYTQLVDVAEGFVPATEIIGSPFLVDPPRPPPGAGAAATPGSGDTQGEGKATPGVKEKEGSVQATTAKSKPPVPGESLATETKETPEKKERLPSQGERKEENPEDSPGLAKKEEKEDRTARRSKERKQRRSSGESRKERSRRKRESRERSHERRRRRSPTTSSPRKRRAARRPETPPAPPRREDSLSRKSLPGVKEEKYFPEGRENRERGSARSSRGQGRVPEPPCGPPPRWTGPIRAHQREEPVWVDTGYWPKSKGVKRREKNRAFRVANFQQGWGPDRRDRRR